MTELKVEIIFTETAASRRFRDSSATDNPSRVGSDCQ